MSYYYLLLIYTLLFFGPLRLVVSKDLIVDADLTKKIGNSYPTLDQAISATLDADDENTITLKASCAGKNQYILRSDKYLNGGNSNKTRLKIAFENAPQLMNDTAVCSRLPTLVIGNEFCLSIGDFSSLVFIGLNIQYTGNACSNALINIQTLTFSSFCFNNSEPSASLATVTNSSFLINSVKTLSMINGIYIYDAYKQVTIDHAQEVTLDNITFVALAKSIDSKMAALNFAVNESISSNLKINNFQLICEPTALVMPFAVWVENVDEVSISNVSISNCDFNGPATSSQAIFVVIGASELIIQDVTLYNLTYGLYYQSFFVMSSVVNSILRNFHIVNLYSLYQGKNDAQIVYFNDNSKTPNGYLQKYSATFSEWSLDNCTFNTYKMLIYGNLQSFSHLGDVIVENFQIADSSLSWKCFLFGLQVKGPPSGTINSHIAHFKMRNVNVTNLTLRYSDMIFVNILSPRFIAAIENARLEITDFGLSSSVLDHSSVIHAEGFGTYLSNVTTEDVTFKTSSNFYLSNTIMSTVIMTNANVNKISLDDYSNFIAGNITTTRLMSLDSSLEGIIYIFAETRPFMVYDSSFKSVRIYSSSYLLRSTNPMVIVQENKFDDIMVSGAGLFQLGKYPYFLTSETYIISSDDVTTHYPSNIGSVFECSFAERSIFQGYPELERVYNNSRGAISEYDPKKSIFFISVNGNVMTDVRTVDTYFLIHVENFQLTNGNVAVINNRFTDISSTNVLTVIGGTIIQGGVFAQNTFSRMSFPGYAFSFIAFTLHGFFLDSNLISHTQQLALYFINSLECDQVRISRATAFNLQAENAFIDITCSAVRDNVTIQDSIFENILQTSKRGVLEPLNFISLKTKKDSADGSSLFAIESNRFYNVTVLGTEGYSQELHQSAFIYMVSLGSKAQFKRNSFHHITTASNGNIMKLSVPLIIFSECKFSELSFGSVDGAIHAIFEALSINKCVFSSSESTDSDGVGLFKLTNPDPQNIVLLVNIQNTIFRDNMAPYSTVLYAKDSAIVLNIDRSDFSNNHITETSSLLTLYHAYNSKISIKNSTFKENGGALSYYPSLKMISIENSGPRVSAQLSDLAIDITDSAKGVFLWISGQQPVTLSGTRISYSCGSVSTFPQFGLFEGDNFNAVFTNLQMHNISMGKVGLFTVNAIMATAKSSNEWRLKILDSNFERLNLFEALIVINSENYLSTALNNLSVILQNTFISQVKWLSSSNGVVSSSTSRIGRSSEENDYAITFNNCTFANLTGSSGLILGSIEPTFDSVASIRNCTFYSIAAKGPGAILNPSKDFFSNGTKKITTKNSSRRHPMFEVTRSSFENISSSSGNILYWMSSLGGTFIESVDNRFADVNCNGNGGLLFASYLPEDNFFNSEAVPSLTVVSRNDTVRGVYGTYNGGIIYAYGMNELFNITLRNLTLSEIDCSANGGVAYLFSPFKKQESAIQTSSRLLDAPIQQPLAGTIRMSESNFSNITTENGGIIYESTPKETLNLYFESNTFNNVSARARGGAFYFNKPKISLNTNTFEKVSAKLAGPIIYSLSDQINLTNFNNGNAVIPPLGPYYSFAPTNLLVEFISLDDGSSLMMESEDTLSSTPIAPNLTSYSLSKYRINFVLVSMGPHGSQIVYDESSSAVITLVFISNNGESTQTYLSSNCYKSSCTALASTVTLRGLAGDLILVNTTYRSDVYTQFQQFYIRLRGCLPGEINNTASYECTYCKPGTYSLSPEDTQCSECPHGAICLGGANINVVQGFYKSTISSTRVHIVECLDNKSNCLGGANNSCSYPYSGPACRQCNLENEYFMNANSGTCASCSAKGSLIAVAVVLLVISIVYQIMMTMVTYNENKRIETQCQKQEKLKAINPGQFLILFSTFTQVISIAANLDGNTISWLLIATNIVGNPYTQVIFPLQCFLLVSTPDPFNALQFKVLLYVLSPLMKLVLVTIFEFFRNLIWKDPEGAGRRKSLVRIGAAAVVLILLEQPGIIAVLCQYLTCAPLDPFMNESYVKTQNSVQCNTYKYNLFKYVVVIPALVFWALIIPLGIFIVLCKIRRKLFTSEHLRTAFGNLYNSYYESSYYWGVVIIIFKVLLFVLNAVLSTTLIFKGIILMMIVHLYFYLIKRRSPYSYTPLFLAEKYCCIAYMITLTLEFLKLTSDNSEIRYACSLLTVTTVAIAGGYLLMNIFSPCLGKLGNFIQKIRGKSQEKPIVLENAGSLQTKDQNLPPSDDQKYRREAISVELQAK